MEKLLDANSSAMFEDSVTRVLEKHWGDAMSAGIANLAALWSEAIRHGWFDLASGNELGLAIAASRRLGRVACPLPLMDGYVGAELFDSGIDEEIRLVVTAGPAELIDAGGAATHVLVVPGSGGRAEIRTVTTVVPAPGLAIPAWSQVTLGEMVAARDIDVYQAARARSLVRLGKAARALGAAERTHHLAVEHAKSRMQFGKPIGSFGAVQQRIAQCQIEIRAANLLVDDAVRAVHAADEAGLLAAEMAVTYVAEIAPRVQLAAHHTLAAIGYFEEHPGPWLFRRVQADIAMLHTIEPAHGSIGDVLIEGGGGLPAIDRGVDGEALRAECLQLIADTDSRDKAMTPSIVNPHAVAAMAEKGWFGFGWPHEYGGRLASIAEQVVLNEEATYHRVGVFKPLVAVMLLGASILRHGTAEQKTNFLPIIASGQMDFCLGYSEPETGSDLASLRTRAVRDGGEWVINGQKSWTSDGHVAEWVWLAARTDPDARPRHAGISVFLFSMNTPGITVQQHKALSGEVCCTVFYDDVRVPDSALIGEVDGGWKVIVDALAGERISMGNIAAFLHRQLDDLLDHVRSDPDRWVGPRGSAKRALITELAVGIQANRSLVRAAVEASASDLGAMFDAAMAGVMGGDLAEKFGAATLSIFGPIAALASADGVPGAGAFEYGLRQSIMFVVGGGTNDVQRGLIARGLGLPK